MNYKFYKWLMILVLVFIGILQFFDISVAYKYTSLVIAVISAVFYPD